MKHQNQAATPDADIARNDARSRYELRIGGEVASYADYREGSGTVRFTHTLTRPEHEGQGLASRLAAFALDDVRTRGLKAVPQCAFIDRYLQEHEKEYPGLIGH